MLHIKTNKMIRFSFSNNLLSRDFSIKITLKITLRVDPQKEKSIICYVY